MNSISANLNIMIKASEKASKILIRDFGEIEKLQVSKKGPTDFVTNADLKAEKIIIEELKKAKQNYSIVSEESGVENNKDKDNTWIIDPIDGKFEIEPDLPYRKSGCAALDMAYVASGRYDGYFQNNLNLWDIAAGIILVKEAGGIVSEIDLSINRNIKIIASSTDINPKLLKKLDNF